MEVQVSKNYTYSQHNFIGTIIIKRWISYVKKTPNELVVENALDTLVKSLYTYIYRIRIYKIIKLECQRG